MASLLPIGCANETPTVIPALCGSTQCTDDQTCQNNTCVPKDAPDPNVCDPACKDGQSCQNNTCVPNAPDPNVCDPACKDGQSCQNGTCKDPEHDPSPKVCDPACDETQYCQNGECKDIACPDGEALCKGGCFDLKTDINNCGECGNACGAKTCYNGECRF
ncbi:MAG: hypothetical protein IJ268_13535, partial [Proteobacteria bacterium]|nr:hypothetical protein [Pseudomonadota bacterium]